MKGTTDEKEISQIRIGFLGIFLLCAGAFEVTKSRSFQFFGGLTYEGETDKKVIALTFDDGPTKNVDEILPLLDKYKAKATFFLIGNDLEKHTLMRQKR